jgi:excisionase family DNA binding protein
MADRLFYTVEEVAQQLGVSVTTVYRLLKSGELHGWRLGRKSGWKVRPEDVDEFIAKRIAMAAGSTREEDTQLHTFFVELHDGNE